MSSTAMIVSPAESVLLVAVEKLIAVIEEENALLRDHRVTLHAGFTDRKNHALRELMAAQRADGAEQAIEALRPLLQELAAALGSNARLLKIHIAAVGEVSDIIIGGLREAESDGTYSRLQDSHRRV